MNTSPKPELAVNRDGRTVAEAINGFITGATEGLAAGACVDIATAYFNLGGYAQLADALDTATGVRLLIGAEPSPPQETRRRSLKTESANQRRAAAARLRAALTKNEQDMATERDLLGFTPHVDTTAKRLIAWLRSDNVEVRQLADRFLHGKAFLVTDQLHGVVAGSSNFTRAGLTSNVELNLGNYSGHTVNEVSDWFDELWDAAEPYDLAQQFEGRFEAHLPQLIYLRMLWERYGAELTSEQEQTGAPKIHLTGFQSDGVWRAKRILAKHNGVLVADEVGLGKTYLAGALIDEAAIERRQRVLVVAPAALRDGPWKAFKQEFNLPMDLLSYDQLQADSRLNPQPGKPPNPKLPSEPNEYALVVIDEAHNLRNPSTQRAAALRKLLAGRPAKQLVLLTATPVNNSLWDLYWLLAYFLTNDGVFADVGIGSLRRRFAWAMSLDPDDLSPRHLFDVLDAVAVRRTRSFVKHHYANDTVTIAGREQAIRFPTPRVRKVTYDLDAVLPGFFDEFAAALDSDARAGTAPAAALPQADSATVPAAIPARRIRKLALARYEPSAYLKKPSAPSAADGTGDDDVRAVRAQEAQLAGLLRSLLLKRFESSPHAFANTCEKMAASCAAFVRLLDEGKVGVGEALNDWIATDSDDEDQVDQFLEHHVGALDDAAHYRVDELRAAVQADSEQLRSFAAQARRVTQPADPNLAVLVEELATIADQAKRVGLGEEHITNLRKVLVFSYFADTVDWIADHLEEITRTDPRLSAYAGRVARLSGDDESKARVLWGFAPDTTDAPSDARENRFDILVTTDVLAEGVNLQQARHIVNYDLPWNPMRLVQRHGRIDRIGSDHPEVFLRCVLPDSRLNDLLGLEERLQSKIKQAAASVGVGEVLPDQEARAQDRDFANTREEIERIRREDAGLFERGGTEMGVQSGEEYRQELRRALEDATLQDSIRSLAGGYGSGMVSALVERGRCGFVFCVRVGDWAQPQFRYAELAVDSGEPAGDVVVDTLDCLHRACPSGGFDTPRTLDDPTRHLAYRAWELVRGHTVEGWNHFSDQTNLQPSIPRLLQRAADLLREHPPAQMDQESLDRAVDSVLAPHIQRVVNHFRVAMQTASDDPANAVAAVLEVIDSLGLTPYSPPMPLPQITADDVHLVCWQALLAP